MRKGLKFPARLNSRLVLFSLVLLMVGGCATLPKDYRREPSQAWDRPQELAAHRAAAEGSECARRLRESNLLKRLMEHQLPLIWAPAQVVVDRPEKAGSAGRPEEAIKLGSQLRPIVEEGRSELIISSPYFIPGKEGIEFFEQLRKRGVRIRILTNSFAGNDVAIVHSGYARYRKDLLKIGVELYELKPSLGAASEQER